MTVVNQLNTFCVVLMSCYSSTLTNIFGFFFLTIDAILTNNYFTQSDVKRCAPKIEELTNEDLKKILTSTQFANLPRVVREITDFQGVSYKRSQANRHCQILIQSDCTDQHKCQKLSLIYFYILPKFVISRIVHIKSIFSKNQR